MKRLLTLVLVSLISSVANAGFIGNSIEATACFPTLCDTASTISGSVTEVVGAGIEFSDGEFSPFFGPGFDFDNGSITISHRATGHSSATFNGYQFVDVGGTIGDILSVTVAADTSGFFSGDPSRIFFDDDNIWINFESLFFGNSGESIVLNVTFNDSSVSVPEPNSLALLFLCLVWLVASRKKKKS